MSASGSPLGALLEPDKAQLSSNISAEAGRDLLVINQSSVQVHVQINVQAAPGLEVSAPELLRVAGLLQPLHAVLPADLGPADGLDKHLHNQIDQLRDRLNAGQPQTALGLLVALLDSLPASASEVVRFRTKANIGHCLMRLDRNDEAAAKLFEAVAHDPSNPKAIANKVLAHILSGDFDAAVADARAELARNPEHEIVAAYLIQAAAHIPGMASPMSELAPGVQTKADVQLADILFSRNRRDDAWIAKAQEGRRQHPGATALALFGAEADIAVISDAGAYQTSRVLVPDVKATLVAAATLLDDEWQRIHKSEHPDSAEASGIAEVAMIGWHLGQEPDKACAKAVAIVDAQASSEGAIMNAALILAENGRRDAARLAIARTPDNPLARWLASSFLVADGDWERGAAVLTTGEVPEGERTIAETLIALTPLRDPNSAADEGAFRPLLERATDDPRSLITIARVARSRGLTDIAGEAFARAMSVIRSDTNLAARLTAAKYAADSDDPTSVIELLSAVIPHDRHGDELGWLAEAHANEFPKRCRNVDFFGKLPPSVRSMPEYSHAEAATLLAVGGRADDAISILQRLRSASPSDTIAILQLAQAFNQKQDRSALLELAASIDPKLLDARPIHRIGIAQLLREALRFEEALQVGYEAVRANPRDARVALGYVGLIFGDRSQRIIPNIEAIGADTFVRLEGPHGESEHFVVDDGESFWGLEHRPLDHDIVKLVTGKRPGDTVIIPKAIGGDETWKVVEVKSKYLHLLHDAMEHFETRFRGFNGLIRVALKGDDITPVLEAVRARAEATRQTAQSYIDRQLPLEWVARMSGGDPISFASYIRSLGLDVFTCVGTQAERDAALERSLAYRGRGAVLDTYTATVAARAGILPQLKQHFGTLFVSRSTIDMLEGMIASARAELGQNTMSISWENGHYVRHTASDAGLQADIDWLADVRTKLIADATIEEILLPDDLHPDVVSVMEKIGPGPLHPMYIAQQRDVLLLSDDAIYRKLASEVFGVDGLWLQPIILQVTRLGNMKFAEYHKALVVLAAHRHGHVWISSADLQRAYNEDGDGSLRDLKTLGGCLGGPMADLHSHVNVALGVLRPLWKGVVADPLKRAKASGILLESVTRGRTDDYASAVGFMAAALGRQDQEFLAYVSAWIGGHFLNVAAIGEAYDAFVQLFERQRAFRRLLSKPFIPRV